MLRSSVLALLFLACLVPVVATGASITLSGTVTYNGPYNADSLHVAVLDTTGPDTRLYAVLSFDVGNSPVSQPYTFNLDNTLAPPVVWVAALLDVDGGGPDSIGTADVVGWYDSNPIPVELSTATSQSGLDFALPTGEIHGAVTFVPGQDGAEIWASAFSQCGRNGLSRPMVSIPATGPYAIIGLYAGTYCLHAYGWGTGPVPNVVCFGDFTCVDPTPVAVGEGEVVHGVNISFINPSPAERTTWGTLKSRYP